MTDEAFPEDAIRVLDHGFVRLDDSMADDLSVANAARVSFARRKTELDQSDEGLIRFLMRDRHGCYDDATEVLTDSGWRRWPEVSGSEQFATRSPLGTLEYQPALRLVRKEFKGHMIGFKGMSIDLLVTPDHRVLTSGMTTLEGRRNAMFSFSPAHAVLWKSHRHVATASWTGPEPETLTFGRFDLPARPLLRLVGFFIGDGHFGSREGANHITFNLRKTREVAYLNDLGVETGLEVKLWKSGQHAISVPTDLRPLFRSCCRDGEKVIPREFLELGPHSLGALYEGLLESDGSRHVRPGKADKETYATTSRELADQVQELALKMGRNASVRPNDGKPGDGHYGNKPRWQVTIYSGRNSRPALCRTRADADNQMGVESYDGSIHCVEVPNGTLYVRRNGYPVFCGNTPFEHNAFRYHIRCPIFVAREWFRHRIGCLTGDTVITFVDTNGHASKQLAKTVDDLWRMWTIGERDGHALSAEQRLEVDRLLAADRSQRSVARALMVGRRSIRTHVEGRRGMRDARWRVRRMRLRVLDESTGEFTTGHVADVIDKGVQPVYKLTLADGKDLTLTENHRLLTTGGWKRMRDAVGLIGEGKEAYMTQPCALMTNGTVAHRDREWLEARRREGKSVTEIAREANCSYHTVRKWLSIHDLKFTRDELCGRTPWNKGLSGYRTRMVVSDQHRQAIQRARSGENSNFWRGGITSQRASIGRWTREQAAKVHAQYGYVCQECHRTGGRLHAHHIVPVWLDETKAREIGNLISLCDLCHRAVHRTRNSELAFARRHVDRVGFATDIEAPTRRGFVLTAHPVSVISVTYVGLRQTYDLTVDGSWHNFVANGLVVHNSFNEFSLRYAKATEDFYVPAAADVRSQVGKPGAYTFEPVDPALAERTRDELQAVYDHAYATYERLVEAGVARELARSVLPVGAYTQFYWTVNARALMNFISLRNSEFAQLEIRRYAEAVEGFLERVMPVTHAAFVEQGRTAP